MLNILLIKHTVSICGVCVVTLYFSGYGCCLLWNVLPIHKVEATTQDASIKVEEAAQSASQKVSCSTSASQKANAAAQKANAAAPNTTLIAKAQQVSQKGSGN